MCRSREPGKESSPLTTRFPTPPTRPDEYSGRLGCPVSGHGYTGHRATTSGPQDPLFRLSLRQPTGGVVRKQRVYSPTGNLQTQVPSDPRGLGRPPPHQVPLVTEVAPTVGMGVLARRRGPGPLLRRRQRGRRPGPSPPVGAKDPGETWTPSTGVRDTEAEDRPTPSTTPRTDEESFGDRD